MHSAAEAMRTDDPRSAARLMAYAQTMAQLSTRRELSHATLLLADVARTLADMHETQRRSP